MKVSDIFYTIDQNMQILGSFVFSNIEPKEYALQFDRIVDKYIDSYIKPAQVGTLEGLDEIQADVDNLRFIKVVDTPISLTSGVGALPVNYRNLLNSRSQVTICGAAQKVYNRLHDFEDVYRVIKNPFTKPKLSSPISRIYGNSIQVYTDNFVVSTVYIDYIRKPVKLIELGLTFTNGYYDTGFNNYDYVDFPIEALQTIMDNLRDRLLELVESNRLNSAIQESQGFNKK